MLAIIKESNSTLLFSSGLSYLRIFSYNIHSRGWFSQHIHEARLHKYRRA